MFSDCHKTAEEANADTEQQSDRQKHSIHFRYRKEINQIVEQAESRHDISDSFVVQEIE